MLASKVGQAGARPPAVVPKGRSSSGALLPLRAQQWENAAIRVSLSRALKPQERLITASTSQASAEVAIPAPPQEARFKRSIWTAIDALALLGSVGGALVALLGIVTPAYALTLPLVLPVVSLIAALQREDLGAEDTRQYLSSLTASLNKDTVQLLAEAKAAVLDVRSELSSGSAAGTKLVGIEGKLSTLEGSIISAGRNAREAAQGLGSLSERLQREQRAQGEALLGSLRQELRRAAAAASADETAALSRLDARLAAVEGSLAGLEVAQSEGLRRLSMSLNSALVDAEATLQTSVRNEVAISLEPMRRLPQLIAAALPPPQQVAPQQLLPPAGTDMQESLEATLAAAAAAGAAAAAEPQQALLLEQLRAMVAEEVAAASNRILEQQGEILARLSAPPRPVSMQEEQWEALGRRLARLERLVEQAPALSEASMAAQLAPISSVLLGGGDGTGGLGALVDGVGRLEAGQGAVMEQVGAVRVSLEAAAGQLLEGLGSIEAAVARMSQEVASVSQAPYAAQQYVSGEAGRGAEGAAVGMGAGDAQEVLSAALAPMAGMLEALAAKVDGVSSEVRSLQEQAAATAAAVVSSSGAALAGAAGGAQAEGSAAALEAAAAAASGLSELRAMLQGLQEATGELSGRLDSFGAALQGGATDEQLSGLARKVSSQLAEQLGALRSEVDGQLGGLEQRLAEAAATAAASAAATASMASMAASATDAGFNAWLQERREALGFRGEAAQAGNNGAASSAPEQAYASSGADQAYASGAAGVGESRPSQQSSGFDEAGSNPFYAEPYQQPAAPSYDASSAAAASTSAYGSGSANGGGSSSAYTPASQPEEALGSLAVPDAATLPEQALLPEGLRLLREGREETRVGTDYGRADALLRGAVACFERAAQSAPADARALGNLGNALLAQGELKRALLEELSLSASSDSAAMDPALSLSLAALRSEASALLTRAGTCFKGVLEAEGWSSRALVNWGRAMTERAQLAEAPEAVEKLYSAAIDKFEAVLEEEPGMLSAQYRCALALEGLAATKPPGGREAATLLADAVNYLSSVVANAGEEDAALRAAAEAALARCEAELAATQAAARR